MNVQSPVGVWGVEGTERGVTHIYLPNERRRASRGSVPQVVEKAATQLSDYFAGSRRRFSIRLSDAPATRFQRDVWAALLEIPFGQVRTYAQIASALEHPRAARAVGNANHANPRPVVVPCHRVVAASGLGGYGGGGEVKRYLLELEGVIFP
ncbi:MAG: methylated-DNA--[protein]-cysteine S-methyltransferase [Acidimicrobiaceae bacterium]|nr:methylated-DNA--[protein]-cysteine S-methyltransferase [Acidimicrobiaceae bacterium]